MPTGHRTARLLPLLLAPSLLAQEGAAPPAPSMLDIGAAYAAKVTATALFVSGRTLDSVLAEELAPDDAQGKMLRPLLQFAVDTKARTVTCTVGGSVATAVATGNLGCTLVRPDASAAALRQRAAPGLADLRPDPASIDWPLGDRIVKAVPPTSTDEAALGRALDAAFAEPGTERTRRTRAIVVVHRGCLVAERYAPGYTAAMPLPGWSMTKTMVNALVGIRVQQGRLDLEAPLHVPEWPALDPRTELRLPDLLSMTSGLRWNERYDTPASQCLQMLFASSDHAAVMAAQPIEHRRGSTFCYASGSTNLICRELRRTFASDLEYWAFPQQALFAPLGMRSALIETDPSGTFVGSSYGFATARDWARLGMLYAQDGVFAGVRVLPAGFVARSMAVAPGSGGRYGWQVWINGDPDGSGPAARRQPELPADLLQMNGHEGQCVCVLPSEQLVVVRLGCTKAGNSGIDELLRGVRAACGG